VLLGWRSIEGTLDAGGRYNEFLRGAIKIYKRSRKAKSENKSKRHTNLPKKSIQSLAFNLIMKRLSA